MKDKEKEIQSILNEYKIMRRKTDEINDQNEEDIEEKSVINPELTLVQMKNLNEKDLNIQVMIALIKKQEEIKKDEKRINAKMKKIKEDIGDFRYSYDENGVAINTNEMQKMSQKYEKIKKEQAKIKDLQLLCKENLSDFEKKTGLTVNNIKEMMIREEEKKREYEEQERLRKERIEQEKLKQEELAKKLAEQQTEGVSKKTVKQEEYDKNDIITIYPYQNTVSYIFEGKEGQIQDIRSLIWGDKQPIFGKYKIKEEEYELTNNKTGEAKEYVSKLNPVVFEVLKSNPQKLEEYMNLKSKVAILYVFDEPQKENKDVAKMMYKYQKQDKLITQKIGYIGIGDKINSRFAYKLGKKQLALPEGNVEERNLSEEVNQEFEMTEEMLEEVPNVENKLPKHIKTRKEIKIEKQEEKKRLKQEQKELKAQKKQEKLESKKKNKTEKQEEIMQEPTVNYEETRAKMEEFRKSVQWRPIETNMATDSNKIVENEITKEDSKEESNDAREI